MKKFTLTLLAMALTLSLSACNTINGVGQDIQKAGGVISGAAK